MRTTARRTSRLAAATLASALTALGTLGGASAATATRPLAAPPAQAPANQSLASTGYEYTAADLRIQRALKNRVTTSRFGTSFSGTVIDAASDRRIWSKNATSSLIPASTTKLVTAHNALTVFGPSHRFSTSVKQGPSSNRVIVQGFGDPSLSSSQLDRMAATTASTLRSRGLTSVRVYVDDDAFPKPSLAYGWKSSYVPKAVNPVRALVRDQRDVPDTSADVGTYFASRLKAHGISSVRYWGRDNVRSGASTLASSQGWYVSSIVSRMLLRSDNEVAESLHKMVARATGRSATWSNARTAQAGVMAREDLAMTALHDGSGLSRANRLSSLQLASLVDRGQDADASALWPLRSSKAMPTAGRTGSLAAKYSRFATSQSRCAVGKVWAKTGTLNDVVSLAGYTYGTDGRLKVFAFVVNGKSSSLSLKQSVDMLAATVNGCY